MGLHITIFPTPKDLVGKSERPHYSLILFSNFIFTCTTLSKKRKQFAFQGFGYGSQKYRAVLIWIHL